MAGRVNYDHPVEVCLLSFSSRKVLFFPFYFYFVEVFFVPDLFVYLLRLIKILL